MGEGVGRNHPIWASAAANEGAAGFLFCAPPVPPHHARSRSTRRSVAGRALRRDPGEEVSDRPVIGRPGDLVPDSGGEEFKEAPDRGVAGTAKPRRLGPVVDGVRAPVVAALACAAAYSCG
jgi:hypothetical protein